MTKREKLLRYVFRQDRRYGRIECPSKRLKAMRTDAVRSVRTEDDVQKKIDITKVWGVRDEELGTVEI